MNLIVQSTAIILCLCCCAGSSQTAQPLCDRGTGHFEANLPVGLTVRVGPVTSGGFATRICEVVLESGGDRIVAVPTASQVDVDVLGADLGLGVPVVAFVIRRPPNEWRAAYEIWSIEKQPRLLRTLTDSDSYRAVDLDFNRQVVISTTDAAAVEGFEGFRHEDYIYPPAVILRFEGGRLMDMSAHYPAQYDLQIAKLRSTLTADAMANFRESDGLLQPDSLPPRELLELRATKAKVLQIVWAYLYSGRPERAWEELQGSWPGSDFMRVKASILEMRAQGIETQVTKSASLSRSRKFAQKPFIYEFLNPSTEREQTNGRLMYGVPGVTGSEGPVLLQDERSPELYEADTEPRPISLWRPPPTAAEQAVACRQETLSLTLDEAGKVQAAKLLVPQKDPELLKSAMQWTFIPASRRKRPVAFQLKLDVQPLR